MSTPVGAIPEFTSESSVTPEPPVEEVVTTTPEAPVTTDAPVGTETPADPLPANDQPADPVLVAQVQGLEREKEKLLEELKSLRGQRRELKQNEIQQVSKQIDALTDVNPDDVTVIEKVLRSKGYITKEEATRMSYESAKQQQLDQFLEKYPEYKPENDPNDLNWNALQRELGFYRMPDDPKLIKEVLERAQRNISKPSTQPVEAQKQRVAVASHGAGGVQRSSPQPQASRITPEMEQRYRDGGWSEEEIQKLKG